MSKKEEIKIVYAEPSDYFPEETRRKYKLGEFAESEDLKKLKAVMLGHAVADALGVPVEFCSREELNEKPVNEMMGWGSYPLPEGCWSDDTSMSLATLDSLKKNAIDYDDIMDNFVLWVSNDEYTPTGEMFDIGRTCFTAIRNYCRTDGKPALECGLDDEYSNGNGSLMRIHPMAFYLHKKGYTYDEAIEIIHKTSALTHAHKRSQIACGIYMSILWELLDCPSKASVVKGLQKARRYYRSNKEEEFIHYECMLCKRIARLDRHSEDVDDHKEVERDEIKSSGYVVDTLEAAIWCLLTTNSYKECVLKAVNLGEDTDTVAAVAGGLAGARYGYNNIPEEWLDVLKRRDYLESMCEEALSAWND